MTNGKSKSLWPHTPDPQSVQTPLPKTLPDGSPWPKISITTASFNQGAFIEETILSVANQQYPNVEHIVIDGGVRAELLALSEAKASNYDVPRSRGG